MRAMEADKKISKTMSPIKAATHAAPINQSAGKNSASKSVTGKPKAAAKTAVRVGYVWVRNFISLKGGAKSIGALAFVQ